MMLVKACLIRMFLNLFNKSLDEITTHIGSRFAHVMRYIMWNILWYIVLALRHGQ